MLTSAFLALPAALACDVTGGLWVGGGNGSLAVLKGGVWDMSLQRCPIGPAPAAITCIACESPDVAWVGYGSGGVQV